MDAFWMRYMVSAGDSGWFPIWTPYGPHAASRIIDVLIHLATRTPR